MTSRSSCVASMSSENLRTIEGYWLAALGTIKRAGFQVSCVKSVPSSSYLHPAQRRKSWKTVLLGSQQFFLRTIAALFVDSIAPAATRRYP
jgi:hypothetical protein